MAWDCEIERLGKQQCTPLGYALHTAGDMLYYIGLLSLIVMPMLVVRGLIMGDFPLNLLILIPLATPFALIFFGILLCRGSQWFARRKDFRYDAASGEATWMEAGRQRVFKLPRDHVKQ